MITLDLKCKRCGTDFSVSVAHYSTFNFRGLPTICPACNDREQGRPTIALTRETIWDGVVRVGKSAAHLLTDLTVFTAQRGDSPCWKMTLKGARYGSDWQGRLDIYSHVDPALLVQDALVHAAHARVVKEVHVVTESRQTLEHGVCRVARRVDPGTEGAELKVEEDEYLVLLPIPEGEFPSPCGTLVYAKAWSKTTLKGLGRQFSASISGTPVWHYDVFGGYRSGRAGTQGMLAVQADDTPLVVSHREDGHTENYNVA